MAENHPPPLFRSHDGHVLPGVRRVIQVAQPAVAADWSVVVPGGRLWRLLNAFWMFTTDATVGNRFAGLQLAVDGIIVWRARLQIAIAASQPMSISTDLEAAIQSGADTSLAPVMPAPSAFIPAGGILSSSSVFVGAADQISGVALWIEEVYENEQDLAREHAARILAHHAATHPHATA